MEQTFIRKIVGKKFGQLSIPLPVFDLWIEKEYSYVAMVWDETTETLSVHPC